VCYGIEAHVEIIQPDIDPNGKPISSPETKHLESFKRRASNGQFFHQPYLGTREFPAYFELVGQLPATPKEFAGEKVLGLMLHDIDFVEDPKNGSLIESNKGRRLRATPRFFEAVLRDGVLRIPPLDHLGGQI
jgi:CRISPR-associated protein Cas5d